MLDEVWVMDVLPSERTVDNFIVRLRKPFEPGPERPAYMRRPLASRFASYTEFRTSRK